MKSNGPTCWCSLSERRTNRTLERGSWHDLGARSMPWGLAAIDALEPTKGEQVLDIGCGCGQISLALADRVGSTGSVVGV